MLGDDDLRPQQYGVDGSGIAARVVDVHRVDAYEFDPAIAQMDRRLFGEEGMLLEIGIRRPMRIPAGVDEYCAPAQFLAFEIFRRHRQPAAIIRADDDAF